MEATKKYELSNITIEFNGVTLHRIKALKDFSNVKAGDLGGWVEKEDNLSQIDDAWIDENAKVYGNAQICGNVIVFDDAIIYDNAKVYGNAHICNNAKVYDNAFVYGDVWVYGNAKVFGNAKVDGNAEVYGNAIIYENAEVYGNAQICGKAQVFGNARIYDNAEIYGKSMVYGDAQVYGRARISGDASVRCGADYIIFKNFWSSGRFFTWTRSNNMWSVGCFYGTGEELIRKAYKGSEKSGKEYEKIVRYVDSILADK